MPVYHSGLPPYCDYSNHGTYLPPYLILKAKCGSLKKPEPSHLVRESSTQLACHVFAVEDLESAIPSIVREVEVQPDKYLIHYESAFKLLNLVALRKLVRPDQPLGTWRLVSLAWTCAPISGPCTRRIFRSLSSIPNVWVNWRGASL